MQDTFGRMRTRLVAARPSARTTLGYFVYKKELEGKIYR